MERLCLNINTPLPNYLCDLSASVVNFYIGVMR
jgi:hypothetical protein